MLHFNDGKILTFTGLKIIETLEKGVKYVQS